LTIDFKSTFHNNTHMKDFLKTILGILITGFIFYYLIPCIFSPSDTTTPPSKTSTPIVIPTTETPSSVTPTIETTIPISAPEPELQSTELINRDFVWDYGGNQWTWNMQIPKALYDYYKGMPRSPTNDYSIYVTHPLDDSLIDQLATSIRTNAQEEGYDSLQTVSFAASFVQSLQYTSDLITTSYDEYPRYPFETLVDEGGDCEDTSILMASLIDALGYGVLIITFPETTDSSGHCGVGVKCGEGIYGSYYEQSDGKYYYLETTASGWEIGELPEEYNGVGATLYPMIPVPILTHNWTVEAEGLFAELKVTVQNLGTSTAKDVYVYAGFAAGNDQTWNHQESALFDLGVNESIVVTFYLTPPLGVHTRLMVQIVYDGYAVDESYSTWFDI
jgi:hypothetical protein